MRCTFLLVLAAAFPSMADAGPCAVQSMSKHQLINAPIAPGGGAIVALMSAGFGTKSDTTAVDKAWRFQDVNNLVEPQVQDIAPGLAVYTLPATGSPELTLLDGDGKEQFKVTRAGSAVAELKAPSLRSIVYQTATYNIGRRGSQTSITGTATFDGALPANAAALVVYEVTKTGNVARSWTAVSGLAPEPKVKNAQVVAYQSGGRCNPGIPNVLPIAGGAKVVVAWLDTSGRLSPVSKPVTARATTGK